MFYFGFAYDLYVLTLNTVIHTVNIKDRVISCLNNEWNDERNDK